MTKAFITLEMEYDEADYFSKGGVLRLPLEKVKLWFAPNGPVQQYISLHSVSVCTENKQRMLYLQPKRKKE